MEREAQPAGWACATCTFVNVAGTRACTVCRRANPMPPTAAERAAEAEQNRARIALMTEAHLLQREPRSQAEIVRSAVRAVRESREMDPSFGTHAGIHRTVSGAVARLRAASAAAVAAAEAGRGIPLHAPAREDAAVPPTRDARRAMAADADAAGLVRAVAVRRASRARIERARDLLLQQDDQDILFRERRGSMSGMSSSSDGASSFGGGGSGGGERCRGKFSFGSRAEREEEHREAFLRSSAGGGAMMRWEEQHYAVREELLRREHARAQRRLKQEHARELQRCRARIGVGSEVACALAPSTARRLGPSAEALAAELVSFRAALEVGDVVLSSSRPGLSEFTRLVQGAASGCTRDVARFLFDRFKGDANNAANSLLQGR